MRPTSPPEGFKPASGRQQASHRSATSQQQVGNRSATGQILRQLHTLSPPFRRPRAPGRLPGEAQERPRKGSGEAQEALEKPSRGWRGSGEDSGSQNPHFRRPRTPGKLRRPETRTSPDPEPPGGSERRPRGDPGKAKTKHKKPWKGQAEAGEKLRRRLARTQQMLSESVQNFKTRPQTQRHRETPMYAAAVMAQPPEFAASLRLSKACD